MVKFLASNTGKIRVYHLEIHLNIGSFNNGFKGNMNLKNCIISGHKVGHKGGSKYMTMTKKAKKLTISEGNFSLIKVKSSKI